MTNRKIEKQIKTSISSHQKWEANRDKRVIYTSDYINHLWGCNDQAFDTILYRVFKSTEQQNKLRRQVTTPATIVFPATINGIGGNGCALFRRNNSPEITCQAAIGNAMISKDSGRNSRHRHGAFEGTKDRCTLRSVQV